VKRHRIPVGDDATSAIEYPAAGDALVALAHGAGADQEHAFLTAVAGALAQAGVAVVTFNFLYMERGRRAPDPGAELERQYRAALDFVAARILDGRALFAGGKSMGGRIASQLCAREPGGVRGLVFLGYPLHPPGKPAQLRSRHLPAVRAPMLFVHGTRDPFGSPDELAPLARDLAAGTRLFIVEGGDHSFKVPKRGPLAQDAVIPLITNTTVDWIRSILNNGRS
jgi:predicted alpha/beta-hydrolase family hydrolase